MSNFPKKGAVNTCTNTCHKFDFLCKTTGVSGTLVRAWFVNCMPCQTRILFNVYGGKTCFINGAPAATRTRDPLLRRQMLYPPELQAHRAILSYFGLVFPVQGCVLPAGRPKGLIDDFQYTERQGVVATPFLRIARTQRHSGFSWQRRGCVERRFTLTGKYGYPLNSFIFDREKENK